MTRKSRRRANTPDVFVIGSGQLWSRDLTLQGLQAIERSRRIFYFSELSGFTAFLKNRRLPGQELGAQAAFGERRDRIYARAAAEIAQSARRLRPVSWVTQGNPAVCCGVTTALLQRARHDGLTVRLIVAPSFLDSLLLDLGIDPARTGLQVYDASRLLLWRLRPDPRVPCVLMQAARCETRLHPLDSALRPGALDRLQRRLEKTYPGTHSVFLVTAAREDGAGPSIRRMPLRQLGARSPEVEPWTSLVLVPATKPRTRDAVLERSLYSFRHLERTHETPLMRKLREVGRHG